MNHSGLGRKCLSIVSFVLALVMTITLFSGSVVFAANVDDTFVVDHLKYTITGDNTVSVGAEDTNALLGDVVIPATVEYEGVIYSVTSIEEDAFQGCSSLKSIIIPDSVTSIGFAAFSGCSSLKSIIIPNGVTSIDGYAFNRCSNLESITISDSVTCIRYSMFRECSSLKTIIVPNGVTSIEADAFNGCSSLKSIIIPDSVICIREGTFRDCSSLESITIPNSVTRIEDDAFNGCSSLETITIPNGVTGIGYRGFSGCKSLKSIIIPDSVTGFGDYVFNGCSSLESITIPDDSVTRIRRGMFQYCSSLKSIIIPDSVTGIEAYAFTGCSSLESITIPNGVTSIGGSAFRFCGSLKSIIIPDSVTSIGEWAFEKLTVKVPHRGTYAMEWALKNNCCVYILDEKTFVCCNWSAPTFVWSDDNKTCTATRICLNDASHNKETETVNTTSNVLNNAIYYTAVFDNGAFETQTKRGETPASTSWQKDFNYTLSGDDIVIKGYKGDNISGNKNIVIKPFACINGKVYKTKLPDDCSGLFYYCKFETIVFEEGLDTSNVTNTSHMFGECVDSESIDLSGFDARNVTDMTDMLYGCGAGKIKIPLNVNQSVTPRLRGIFVNTNDETVWYDSLPANQINSFWIERDDVWLDDFEYTISGDNIVLTKFIGTEKDVVIKPTVNLGGVVYKTKLPNNCSHFFDSKSIESIKFEKGLDTSNVTDTSYMFRLCPSLENIDLSGFDTSNVTDMSSMFSNCGIKTIDLSGFDTSNVTDMSWMFAYCESLKSINLSGFDTSRVKNMGAMFYRCYALESVDLGGFDTSNVETMGNKFFSDCDSLIEVRVPLKLKQGIAPSLPYTFVDSKNICYNSLPSGQKTSFWIAKKGEWNVNYVWSEDGKSCTATRTHSTSSRMNVSEKVETVPIQVIKKATCSEDGITKYMAVFEDDCFSDQTKSIKTPATGHNWSAPTYKWSADGKKCTATRVCKNDKNHKQTETVNANLMVTKKATCASVGTRQYSATFKNPAFSTQNRAETIAALGHKWGAVTYKWSADGKTCTATRVCKNDNTHKQTETVKATAKVVKKATATAMGKTKYTAKFKNAAFGTKTVTKTDIKIKQPMTVTAKTTSKKPAVVKYANLKSKNQTIAAKKAYTVSKTQGKVTYKKLSGNGNITVVSNGKITVKKGLKKGTYKLKVRVTAAGGTKYKSGYKDVIVYVKVR